MTKTLVATPDPDEPNKSPFDAAMGDDGRWSMRDLQGLMGYVQWKNLTPALNRAKAAARNQGLDVEGNFSQSRKDTPGLRGPDQADYRLTRIAAYLLAMNGDPNKPEVAAAQAYFAVKAREAELAQQEIARPKTGAELVLQMAQELVAQEQRVAAVERAHAVTAAKVAAIEGRHDEFTALGYAKLHGFPTGRSFLQRVGIKATALMRAEDRVPHRRQDATFGEINVYPIPVLERAFAEVPR